MRLYGYWRSSSSYRVRIALHLKNLEYEYVPISLEDEEHSRAAFRDHNPMHQVPVLELATGERFSQSLPIIELLEELHPSPALLPASPGPRARARQLAEIVNSGIQPLQNRFVLETLERHRVDSREWAKYFVDRGLRALEAHANTSPARFLVGDQVTLAEVFLVPQLYNARRLGVSCADFPTLTRIDAECQQLDAFAAAIPERQLDATENERRDVAEADPGDERP